MHKQTHKQEQLEVKADKDLSWRREGGHEVPFNTQLAEVFDCSWGRGLFSSME